MLLKKHYSESALCFARKMIGLFNSKVFTMEFSILLITKAAVIKVSQKFILFLQWNFMLGYEVMGWGGGGWWSKTVCCWIWAHANAEWWCFEKGQAGLRSTGCRYWGFFNSLVHDFIISGQWASWPGLIVYVSVLKLEPLEPLSYSVINLLSPSPLQI